MNLNSWLGAHAARVPVWAAHPNHRFAYSPGSIGGKIGWTNYSADHRKSHASSVHFLRLLADSGSMPRGTLYAVSCRVAQL